MSDKTKAEERREFIRTHASRLDAAYVSACMIAGRTPNAMDTKRTWELAKELWDGKPEDC